MSKRSACPLPKDVESYLLEPVPILGPLTTQHLLLIISGACAALTIFISYFLIIKHLHRYTEPKQQRQIIRIIFTPVVYATLSALSIINYKVAEYMQPLVDLYETLALVSLFLLFVEYVAPDEHTRTKFFAELENTKAKSMFRPSKGSVVVSGGSQWWYEIKHFALFSYIVGDVILTIVQELTLWSGDFCETSWSPRWAHVWITVIENLWLGWCVIAVVNFYVRMKSEPEFAHHKPGLKLLSFKLIVALNFFQSIILSVVDIPKSQKLTGYDVTYDRGKYHESMKQGLATPRMGTLRAAANAFNPMDIIRGILLLPRYAPSLIGKKSGANRVNSVRTGDQHLEPMSQRSDVSEFTQPGLSSHIPDTGYSNVYGTPLQPGNPVYYSRSSELNNSNLSLAASAASEEHQHEEETLDLTKYAK